MAETRVIPHVHAFISAHRLIAPGHPVVVAVSGGPDSLCLLHALAELRSALGIGLHVAHLDHMLRGAESAGEAAFVAEEARRLGLPATVEAADVAGLASARRLNRYAAGRMARYAMLARVAAQIGAQAVATAHTADDQAETVLVHLLRGAGPEGLSGMRPVVPWEIWGQFGGQGAADAETTGDRPAAPSPPLIRPLLGVTRAEVEAFCAERGLRPRRDPSNEDVRHMRSRVRHRLLPQLMEYNPRIVEALARTAAICADEQALVEELLDAAWPGLARVRAGGVDIDGGAWRELHPALQRAALRRAYALLGGGETLGLEHVEAARAAAAQGVGGQAELPGGVPLTAGYGGSFTLGEPLHEGPQLAGEDAPLAVPGVAPLAAGWALEAALAPEGGAAQHALEAYLDAAALAPPLLVRRRRPGDRYRPAGGRGSRLVQDALVDAKVPRALRDAWPLLVAGETIVWVPGARVAEGFVARPGRGAIRVRIVPPRE